MRISTIAYEIKQGFVNIGRNWMFSLASVITMTACIFLFGLFFSIVMNMNYITQSTEKDVPITVFFEENTSDADMEAVRDLINARPEVIADKTNFVSADEAWETYKSTYFGDSADMAEGFKDNPLANSANYEVYVNDIDKQSDLVDYISGLDHVRSVQQSQSTAQTLSSFNKLVGLVSIAIIAILLVIAVFLISNTVTIGISIRKEEIKIMKLIGATNLFVRAPFLLEGVILGLVGAAIPLVIVYFMYDKVSNFIATRFEMLSFQLLTVSQVFQYLLPVGLILGIGIGFFGSLFSARKHLRV
ncbi:MAG: permease-like cell division protein FtsX [Lachnospiraceae bacterium]